MKTKKPHYRAQKRPEFAMAMIRNEILANCPGYKIGDKVDGTVSEQVEIDL